MGANRSIWRGWTTSTARRCDKRVARPDAFGIELEATVCRAEATAKWMPAFAGMTEERLAMGPSRPTSSSQRTLGSMGMRANNTGRARAEERLVDRRHADPTADLHEYVSAHQSAVVTPARNATMPRERIPC